MTQKEKARAYDKALKIAKKEMSKDGIKNDVIVCGVMKKVFPELAESEDERIKKELINYFTKGKEYLSLCSISKNDILSWLEKQDEHKSNWDINDDWIKTKIIKVLLGCETFLTPEETNECIDWIKSIKQRLKE